MATLRHAGINGVAAALRYDPALSAEAGLTAGFTSSGWQESYLEGSPLETMQSPVLLPLISELLGYGYLVPAVFVGGTLFGTPA